MVSGKEKMETSKIVKFKYPKVVHGQARATGELAQCTMAQMSYQSSRWINQAPGEGACRSQGSPAILGRSMSTNRLREFFRARDFLGFSKKLGITL